MGSVRRIRVLVADDHAPTRAGVRASLDTEGFEVVGEASNARQAVEPGGRPAARRLPARHPHAGERDHGGGGDQQVAAGLRGRDAHLLAGRRRPLRRPAGRRAWLPVKDMDPDRLGPALHGVLAGEAALPRSLVSRVLEEFQGRSRRKLFVQAQQPTQLTSREWEIMELLRRGCRPRRSPRGCSWPPARSGFTSPRC